MIRSLSQLEEDSPSISSSTGALNYQQDRFSNIFCIFLQLSVKYFRSTTYFWMFNEAIYLHQLITRALFKPYFKPLVIIAYSVPFVTTLVYIIVRSMFLEKTNLETSLSHFNLTNYNLSNLNNQDLDVLITYQSDPCWRLPSKLAWQEWVINAPNLAILIVSLNYSVKRQS